jgi:hypothetical protein
MFKMKSVGQRNLSYWVDKLFLVKAPVTLTFDLKINRDHLLIITNLNTKYEDCVSDESLVIGRTRKNRRPAGRADSSIPPLQLCCAGV